MIILMLLCDVTDKCSQATQLPPWFQPAERRLLRCPLCQPLPQMRWAAGRVLPPLTPSPTGRKTEQVPVSMPDIHACKYCCCAGEKLAQYVANVSHQKLHIFWLVHCFELIQNVFKFLTNRRLHDNAGFPPGN